LTRHDVHVVERVDQHLARASGLRTRGAQRLVHAGTELAHLGTVAPRGLQLGYRGALRHVDDGGDAELLRGERDALRVVPGGGRDDAALLLLRRQAREPRVRTADLERPGALQVLAL